MGIKVLLLISRQGKIRLSKWYAPSTLKYRERTSREITSQVLARPRKLCNFLEWKDQKIVYKRYASLYFVAVIDNNDNELICLEMIHHFVEVLDRYFGSETSKKRLLTVCSTQDDLMDASNPSNRSKGGFMMKRHR
eukprot:GSMAST32.ASY1.ANO1.2324.1 assembled CDS